MRKFRLLFILALAVFTSVSCTKEGPEGPPGAGTTTYSEWFSFAETDWADSLGVSVFGNISRANKAAPALTQEILDQGVILTYTDIDGVHLLPLNITHPLIENETLQLGAIASLSKLTFYLASLIIPDATGFAYTGPLRYVVIPGSIEAGRNTTPVYGGFTEAQLKAMPYEQILSTFNIPANGTNIR